MNSKLAQQLNNMATKDLAMRSRVEKGANWNYSIDRKNTKKLKEIVSRYGWPTIKMVGKRASRNAWLLAQHADEDKNFQRLVLNLMKKSYKQDSASVDLANVAYLIDRLLMADKKKQEFGTQFIFNKKNELVLYPLRNPATVNKRRKKYNLRPIERDILDAKNYIYTNKKTKK